MKVEWRPAAVEDFAALIDTAGGAGSRSAVDRKAMIESKILLLERFKDFGRKTKRPGVRELVLDTAPVVIVFRVSDGVTLVLRLFEIAPSVPAASAI